MSDYLLTGAVTNALNSPSVTAEEAPKLKPFVALAEKLGAFAGQMVDVGLKGVEIAYEGDVAALNVRPLSAAALAGVPAADAGGGEHGLRAGGGQGTRHHVSESRQETSPVYDSLIRIKVNTEMGRRSFAGTVVAGAPRIVEVKGMELDAAFAPGDAVRQQPRQAGLHRRAGRTAGREPASTSPPSTSVA